MQLNDIIQQIIQNISQVNKSIYLNMRSRGYTVSSETNWSLYTSAFAIFKIISQQNQVIEIPKLEKYLQDAIGDLKVYKVSQDLINNLQTNFNNLKTNLIEQKRVENELNNFELGL